MSTTTPTSQGNSIPQLSDLSLDPPPSSPALPIEILLKIFRLNLRDVSIGINTMKLASFGQRFKHFIALKHLSITCTQFSLRDRLDDFRPSDFLSYLCDTTALRTVILPRELCQHVGETPARWSQSDVKEVEEAAESKGIELSFA